MNRNKVIEEILDDMPKEICDGRDLKTLKLKARYLYLALCKKCHYDIDYNLGDNETKNMIFNSKEDEEKTVGVCNEFSLTGVELFKRAGIDAMAIDVDGNEYREGRFMEKPLHIYFLFTLDERDSTGNKEFYLADPSFDLKRVQIGCQTKYFASKPTTAKNISGYPSYLSTMSQLELKDMDNKLGYFNGEYTDSIIRQIIYELKSKKEGSNEITFEGMTEDVDKLLEMLKLRIFDKSKDIGVSDRQSSFKMIFHQAFALEMAKGFIDFDTTKKENGEYESFLVVKKGDKRKRYTYSNESGTYIPDIPKRNFTDLDDDPLLN